MPWQNFICEACVFPLVQRLQTGWIQPADIFCLAHSMFLKFRICCQHKTNSDFWLLMKNESGHYQAHMSIRKQLAGPEQQLYPLDRPHGLQLTTDLPLTLFPAHFSSQASIIQETWPAPVGRVYNYSLAVFLLDLNKYVPCGVVEWTATKTIQSCFLLKRVCYFKKQVEGFQMANRVQPSFKDQNWFSLIQVYLKEP